MSDLVWESERFIRIRPGQEIPEFRGRPDPDPQHGLDAWVHYSLPLFPRAQILLLSETLLMIEKLCRKLFHWVSVLCLLLVLNRKQLLR
jgi:hypothetical protein